MKINKRIFRVIIVSTALLIIAGLFVFVRFRKALSTNVLLISIDSLRPDHLGCYGYQRDTSPNIDKFAKEGARFIQAIAQGTWTLPSITSIITGTYPCIHGVNKFGDVVRLTIPSLPEILHKQGYVTGFICPGYLDTVIGLSRRFDMFDNTDNEDAHKLTKKALNWITANKRKPFFLWIHYLDTHYPYKPYPPFDKLFIGDALYQGRVNKLPVTNMKIAIKALPKHLMKDDIANPNYYVSQYDGSIKSVDEQLGVMFAELSRLKLDKNTLIIITADHGETLGEHGVYFAHVTGLESVIRVPLILRYAKLIPGNKVIDCQVQSIDIAPTILEILNIDEKAPSMQGFSLLPLMLGKNNYPNKYTFIYMNKAVYGVRSSEWKLFHIGYKMLNSPYFLKQTDPALRILIKYFKKLTRGREDMLINLKQDQLETKNLSNINKAEFKVLKNKLNDFLNTCNNEDTTAFRGVKFLDKETREKLRSLGYTQ